MATAATMQTELVHLVPHQYSNNIHPSIHPFGQHDNKPSLILTLAVKLQPGGSTPGCWSAPAPPGGVGETVQPAPARPAGLYGNGRQQRGQVRRGRGREDSTASHPRPRRPLLLMSNCTNDVDARAAH